MMQRRGGFLYPVGVGLLLGLLQTGLLLQLSFTLSSGFGTYLLLTVCWLTGGALGVLGLARPHTFRVLGESPPDVSHARATAAETPNTVAADLPID